MGEPSHGRAGQDGAAGERLTLAVSDRPGRLRAAGVAATTVRYDGMTQDFRCSTQLSGRHATRAAIAQAISVLREALRST
jgi:hypothetical protein